MSFNLPVCCGLLTFSIFWVVTFLFLVGFTFQCFASCHHQRSFGFHLPLFSRFHLLYLAVSTSKYVKNTVLSQELYYVHTSHIERRSTVISCGVIPVFLLCLSILVGYFLLLSYLSLLSNTDRSKHLQISLDITRNKN